MKISNDKVVSIEYTLKNAEGTILDTSVGGAPLEYIHGRGYLITGLEKDLEGKEEGEEFSSEVAPKDAYGEYDESMVVEVDRKQFPEGIEIEEGMQFEAAYGQLVTVKSVTNDKITIDANHALAGQTLYFDVKVVSVREATPEELSTGLYDGGCGCACDGDCSSGDCGGGDCSSGGCGCGC